MIRTYVHAHDCKLEGTRLYVPPVGFYAGAVSWPADVVCTETGMSLELVTE